MLNVELGSEVKVPENLGPGDTFEVLPPAMMVQVPENAKPGDKIVFWSDAKGLAI